MSADDSKIIPAGIPFFQIGNAFVLDKTISHVAKCVYMYLMYRANTDGRSFPSMRLIAAELGMSTATVNKSMTILEQSGWVEIQRTGREAGKANRPVNNYVIHGTNVAPDERGVVGAATRPVARAATEQQSLSNNTQEQQGGVAALAAMPTKNAYGPDWRKWRDDLWDVLTNVHGETVTKSEKSHRGKILNDLIAAEVTPAEYVTLVAAFVSKWGGKQPGPASIANRVGEYRHYAEFGPLVAPDSDELVQERVMAQHLEETK